MESAGLKSVKRVILCAGEVHIPGQMPGCGGALGDNGPVQPQQLLGQPYPSHLSI